MQCQLPRKAPCVASADRAFPPPAHATPSHGPTLVPSLVKPPVGADLPRGVVKVKQCPALRGAGAQKWPLRFDSPSPALPADGETAA